MFEMPEEYDVQKVRKESKLEGEKIGKIAVAKNLLKEGIDTHVIIKTTGLSEEEVKKLQEEPEVLN